MILITDRTESSTYEYTDLNRVERAALEISTAAQKMGIDLSLSTKRNWGMPGDYAAMEWPVESQMRRYIENIHKIKAVFPCSVHIPYSMDNLTYSGANNIERVLQIALQRIENIPMAYRYSGEIFAGEE